MHTPLRNFTLVCVGPCSCRHPSWEIAGKICSFNKKLFFQENDWWIPKFLYNVTLFQISPRDRVFWLYLKIVKKEKERKKNIAISKCISFSFQKLNRIAIKNWNQSNSFIYVVLSVQIFDTSLLYLSVICGIKSKKGIKNVSDYILLSYKKNFNNLHCFWILRNFLPF